MADEVVLKEAVRMFDCCQEVDSNAITDAQDSVFDLICHLLDWKQPFNMARAVASWDRKDIGTFVELILVYKEAAESKSQEEEERVVAKVIPFAGSGPKSKW